MGLDEEDEEGGVFGFASALIKKEDKDDKGKGKKKGKKSEVASKVRGPASLRLRPPQINEQYHLRRQ